MVDAENSEATIFVSIASYRDKLCSQTISDLFQQAALPQRIFVGVCEQNRIDEKDELCDAFSTDIQGPQFMQWWHTHCQYIRLDASQARGPTWARYWCMQLFHNQDYVFQIDSHTRFVQHWDVKLLTMINQLHKAGFPRAVLSHYCDTVDRFQENDTEKDDGLITVITTIQKEPTSGVLHFRGAEYLPRLTYPRRHALVGGGMLFLPRQAVIDVPFDPLLYDLFFGEEILYSIRLWTHGYDVFSPNINIVYHTYVRSAEPKYWDDRNLDMSAALKHVQDILHGNSKQGLGHIRTMDAFWSYLEVPTLTDWPDGKDFRIPERLLHPTSLSKEGYTVYACCKGNSISFARSFYLSALLFVLAISIAIIIVVSVIRSRRHDVTSRRTHTRALDKFHKR